MKRKIKKYLKRIKKFMQKPNEWCSCISAIICITFFHIQINDIFNISLMDILLNNQQVWLYSIIGVKLLNTIWGKFSARFHLFLCLSLLAMLPKKILFFLNPKLLFNTK